MTFDAMDLRERPHRRYNPLTAEWVLVSPHRAERPWHGFVESSDVSPRLAYDPGCYLCPGNARAGGRRNPGYENTFVFDNDFPALLSDTPAGEFGQDGLLLARADAGRCRVVCYSPDHSTALARMPVDRVRLVVDTWVAQFRELMELPETGYVQIFENRGEAMGCSNSHPHGQIWASQSLPNEIVKERDALAKYAAGRRSCLLCDYRDLEERLGERMVCRNNSFTALVPFWAIWPFEVMLLSRRHVAGIDELTELERSDLAAILRSIGVRYDNLFSTSFPYTMGFHQRPASPESSDAWHLHAHYYPPLLRSAMVRKFMVGYEMLATPQRDFPPETAAARLRELPEVHWRDR